MRSRQVLLLALGLCLGCSRGSDHGHEHGGGGAHEPHQEEASIALTRWGERAQLFVEFRALVSSEESSFAAHLTQLEGYKAIDGGEVEVELSGGGAPAERFTLKASQVGGIFRVKVRPVAHGPRQLTITLKTASITERYELGEQIVFATRAGANVAIKGAEEGGITYLLEQQWRRDFGVTRVKTQEIAPNIAAFATLSAPASSRVVLNAPSQGRISVSEEIKVGQTLARGATVFTLAGGALEGVDLAQLEGSIQSAQIEVEFNKREYERLEALASSGVIAKSRAIEAKRAWDLASARQESERRRKATALAQQRLKAGGQRILIPSPISGQLVESFVSDGVWVEQNQPLGVISGGGSTLWLEVAVPEAYASKIKGVFGVWFKPNPKEDAVALGAEALLSVGPRLDPQRRTLPVRFNLGQEHRLSLYVGMSFPVRLIHESPRRALVVSEDAVIDDAGDEVVFVQTMGERFERRVVRLGERDRGVVEVLEGLSEGEWVVARGAHAIKLASTSTATIGHGHAH